MATGNSQTKLMDEIQDSFLLCKICFEIYRRPKTLVCLHVFCEECLEKTADAEFERSYRYMLYTRTVACPICRKKTELPGGGVRRLPDNFLVANLADVLNRKKPSGSSPSCEICKPNGTTTNNVAISKCLDCCKLLCKTCVDLHRRTKVTASHGLYDVEVEKDVECKVHSEEVVRFYCEPCEMCICVVCTFQEHKGHDVSSFTDGMRKYANSLDALLSACKLRMTDLREQIRLIETCQTDIKQTEDHIRDVAIDSISAVRRKEKDMLATLGQAYGAEVADFLRSKEDLQDALENIQSTCSLTDIILKDKSIELLLLKKEIQQKLEGLLNSSVVKPPDVIPKQVKFVPGSLTFGYLDVDGQGKPEEYKDLEYKPLPALMPSESVDVQTDKMEIKESATTMGQLAKDFNTQQVTQTEQVTSLERGTSPLPSDTKSECTMALPETRDSGTMTPCTPTVKRRIQTVRVLSADQGTATAHMDTSHKFTNTLSANTEERSTLTKRLSCCDEFTDTGGLVHRVDQETCTPPPKASKSAGTLTDLVRQLHKSTLTVGPDLKNKVTSTPRLCQVSRETMTPYRPMLDMGVTAKLLGTDKACATKTTITSDSFVLGTDVRTRDQQSETPWDRTLRLTVEKGTMPDLQTKDVAMRTEGCISHDQDTYTNYFNMVDKTMETEDVDTQDASTGTFTCQLVHKGTETVKRKTSDKGVHVQEKVAKLETRTCDTQTAIQLQHYIPDPNTDPCHQGSNTVRLEHKTQETSTVHIQLVDMGSGERSVDSRDTGVGEGQVHTAEAQSATTVVSTVTRGMLTTKIINPSQGTSTAVVETAESGTGNERGETKDGSHDAYRGDTRDADSNTDMEVTVRPAVTLSDVATGCDVTELHDKAVGTAVVVSHQGTVTHIPTVAMATNTEARQEREGWTSMESWVDTRETDTETAVVQTAESGSSTIPVITLSTCTETTRVLLTDSSISTTSLQTETRAVGAEISTTNTATDMPHVQFTDTGVDPEHREYAEKLVGTAAVELVDKGVGHVGKLMHTRSTDMPLVETRSVETHTHVPTVEKATYMPQTVTITTGTSTQGVETLNKQVNTPRTELLDSGTMTPCKRYADQDTTMERGVRSADCSTSTIEVSVKDMASDADVTPLMSSGTNTPARHTAEVETSTLQVLTLSASTTTQHRVTTADQLSGTPHVSLADKETASPVGPSADCSTMTHTETRSVGVLKRPQVLSQGMGTATVENVEAFTNMDSPYTKDVEAMTDVTETAEVGITSRPRGLVTRGTGTPATQHRETGTGTTHAATTARASSPFTVITVDRESSPIHLPEPKPVKTPTANKKVGVKPRTANSYTTTPTVELKDCATGEPLVRLTDRQCSPVVFEIDRSKVVDMGTSMPESQTTERETSPLRPFSVDRFTATTRIQLADTGSNPVRIPTRSCGVHVGVMMESKECGTPAVYTSETGTAMPQIYLATSGTSTPQVTLSERGTSTPQVAQRHKNVSTEHVVLVDASTPAPVDIMAAYLEAIRPKRPVTVTRGTGTEPVVTDTKELSPVRWPSEDKASSPLRVLQCDKAVSVSGKGEILEPVDKFHKAGGSKARPARPLTDSAKPKLACITEDHEKASSEDEAGPSALPGLPSFPRRRLQARPNLFTEGRPMMRSGAGMSSSTSRICGLGLGSGPGGGLTHTERLWQSSPRLGLRRSQSSPSHSSFAMDTGRGSPILMKVEMGTNTSDVTTETRGTSTPPIDRLDKAICTEAVTVDGKMAECISKLKTVRQRLETTPNPTYSHAGSNTTPTYSHAGSNTTQTYSHTVAGSNTTTTYSQAGSNTDAPKMMLCPPVQSTMSTRTGTSPLMRQGRSVSLCEGLDESDCSPFVSPLPLRKANAVLESMSESSDSDKMGGGPVAPQSPRTRQALARKQRLDLSQMLRSSSMPETEHPPFSPLPKPKIHHTRVIPPLNIGQQRPKVPLRKPKPKRPVRPPTMFALTPELEEEEEERGHSDDAATDKAKKASQRERLKSQLPFEERRAITRTLLRPANDSGSSSGSDSSGSKSPSHFRPQRLLPRPRGAREPKMAAQLKSLKEDEQ